MENRPNIDEVVSIGSTWKEQEDRSCFDQDNDSDYSESVNGKKSVLGKRQKNQLVNIEIGSDIHKLIRDEQMNDYNSLDEVEKQQL